MNIYGVAVGAIQGLNPLRAATLQVSTGFTTDAARKQVPTYDASAIRAQVQAMGWRDLQQIDGLNKQGKLFKVYAYGAIEGVVRSGRKGGDLITFTDTGEVYLTTQVLEEWPGWCSIACTLQNGS